MDLTLLFSNLRRITKSYHQNLTIKQRRVEQLERLCQLGPSIFYPHAAQAEPVIRIMIKDDGSGISSEVLPHIFDPFFTTKPAGEGTGLGLAICHGIISAHSGHIWAESEAGRGTTFFIELPVAGIED